VPFRRNATVFMSALIAVAQEYNGEDQRLPASQTKGGPGLRRCGAPLIIPQTTKIFVMFAISSESCPLQAKPALLSVDVNWLTCRLVITYERHVDISDVERVGIGHPIRRC
jgi:hypothetical protein